MITLSSTELYTWVASFMWPLTRILGLIATAPLFGNLSVPVRLKVALGVMLALVLSPGVSATPASDPMSLAGLAILAQQLVIGLAMGFAMRIVFAAAEMAGEITGLTMGFGFATFFDPQTRARTSVIAQLLALLTLMIFLALNVHLMMLSTLAHSFVSMPVTEQPIGTGGFRQIAIWGGVIFSSGVQLALPMIAALLITNIALGILTRAAPQLNLFGIGFPVTVGAGFLVVGLVLPFLATPLARMLEEAITFIRRISG